jgi:hypothetical protein
MTTARVPGLDLVHAAIERGYDRGWSDGLPVVPASKERTAEFLATTGRPPDEVIGRLEPMRREVTVELAAINAIMAGCLPGHFPVVLAAWDALMLERAVVDCGWQSTSGPAPLIVVNGPVRHRLGFNRTAGVLGPGFRANATVARAIGLIVLNGLGVRPQVFEQPTQGIPGRWAMCVAENEEESPWEPLSTDGALSPGTDGVSAMLVRSVEYIDNRHTRDPEKLLADFADTLSRTGALVFRHASAGIIFCPEHAQLLAGAGMTKHDVRRWLVAHCHRRSADLRRVGKDGVTDKGVRYDLDDPEGDTVERIFETDSPKDLMIMVAGARNAGISTVVRLFASWSQVTARVEPQRIADVKEIRQ